jgi:hypothetical protein
VGQHHVVTLKHDFSGIASVFFNLLEKQVDADERDGQSQHDEPPNELAHTSLPHGVRSGLAAFGSFSVGLQDFM